jgi:hypothetical protein
MKPKQTVLRFSHETRLYAFRGKELSPPSPGSFDASKWTPPTHQLFVVEIQTDGLWLVKLNGAQIVSGDGAKRSRAAAAEIIQKHCRNFLT